MSKSKDQLPRAGRGVFLDASTRHPCPVCGKGWCQIRRDGALVLCKRVAHGAPRTNAEGTTYWIHVRDGAGPGPRWMPPPPAVAAAAPLQLDAAYRAVLAALALEGAHRAALRRRGLDDATIAAAGYRTLPVRGRAELARAIVAAVGPEVAASVPGYHVAGEDARTWPSLAGAPGLLVPVRDVAGRIVALKVRRDDAGDGPRYLYVTSARHGGASALAALHVPVIPAAGAELRITEGEIKADVATALSGIRTLSVPGVASWRTALAAAAQLAPARIRVAFDADWRTNTTVRDALGALLAALRAAGHSADIETWDPAWKGVDDYLAARAAGRAA